MTSTTDDAVTAPGRNAQLSWIPRKFYNLRLEETKIFSGINEDATENLILMVRHINRTFPFYLPKRYLSLDYKEMQRKSTDGQYWTNSSFALVSTVMHSTEMWHQCNLIEKDEPFVEVTSFLSESMKAKLQEDLHESDSAMEFLSDPWVMVQATHCPGVLNQWLVAAYAEMLTFQRQISDFHYRPYPEMFKEAVSLLHAAESVKEAISRSFHVLKTLISIIGTNYCLDPKKSPLKELQNDLDAILRQLKKVRSVKGQNIIKALKRLCWNNLNEGPLQKPLENCTKCVFYDSNLRYLKYWEQGTKNHFFLPASNQTPCIGSGCPNCLKMYEEYVSQHEEFLKIMETKRDYKDKNLNKKKMAKFYEDHLKDRFETQTNNKFLAHLVKKEMLFLHWKFESIENLKSNVSQLQASDFGVVFGIMMLKIELEQSNIISAMTTQLHDLSGIGAKAVDCDGPNFTYREITEYLGSKNSFPQKKLREDLMDYTDDELAEKVLMARIHGLLHNTSKLKFEKIELEFLIRHGSWHFIYQLMPCFVASYLDLCKEESVSLAENAKEFYCVFISNLVDSFAIDTGIVCSGYRTNSYLKWKFDSVISDLKFNIYGASASPTVVRQLQEKCFDVLTDVLGRTNDTTSEVLNRRWRNLLYDFSDRMQVSLLKTIELPRAISDNRDAKDVEYALSTLCRNIAGEIFLHCGFKDNPKFCDSRLLLSAIFTAHAKSNKLKIVKLRSSASKCKTWLEVQSIIEKESEKLSEHQRFGIALYLCLSAKDLSACVARHNKVELYRYPCNDWMEPLIMQITRGDLATAAEKISFLLSPSLSEVSLDFALETAPTCYSPIIDRVKNNKVTMEAPGQNTFCPIPHCRWCGFIKDPSAMRVCRFCTDNTPNYPDTHLFCSSECEDRAMKNQHGEQHAEFLEYKLGLKEFCYIFPEPLLSTNYIMYKVYKVERSPN